VNTLPTNPFAATLMVCGLAKLRVEVSGSPVLGIASEHESKILCVKCAAYRNAEKKNCMRTTVIENLNIKLKIYNYKYFKNKTCNINIYLRDYYA
jgi:hypothetical protein